MNGLPVVSVQREWIYSGAAEAITWRTMGPIFYISGEFGCRDTPTESDETGVIAYDSRLGKTGSASKPALHRERERLRLPKGRRSSLALQTQRAPLDRCCRWLS